MKETTKIKMKEIFARHFITSTSTAILDYIIFIFLTGIIGIYYLHSAMIAFAIANLINYSISRNWAFNGTRTSLEEGYFRFIIVGVNGMIITLGLLSIFVELLNVKYFIARVIIYFITGAISFILNYFFTFGMHKIKKRKKQKLK